AGYHHPHRAPDIIFRRISSSTEYHLPHLPPLGILGDSGRFCTICSGNHADNERIVWEYSALESMPLAVTSPDDPGVVGEAVGAAIGWPSYAVGAVSEARSRLGALAGVVRR